MMQISDVNNKKKPAETFHNKTRQKGCYLKVVMMQALVFVLSADKLQLCVWMEEF